MFNCKKVSLTSRSSLYFPCLHKIIKQKIEQKGKEDQEDLFDPKGSARVCVLKESLVPHFRLSLILKRLN